ncbi:DUF2142 domain-containing protein [Glaciihabitans sp. UYNi722]|uniref:DUF2142 domain-containing protein n=1 Tax=Glaciihabitans sp. UYNi722 TaxID=3156344 RepID=UPI003391BDE0
MIAWLALSLASLAWAASTPLAGSPDEPAHIIKAASVVRGEFLGARANEPYYRSVEVPIGLSEASSWPCFMMNSSVSAACAPPTKSGLELRSALTSAGLYNPVYYVLIGWPSLFVPDAQLAVLAMRALSAILSSFFLAFVFVLLLRMAPRLIAGIAFFAALTPMVLFLNGSVSPNSLEIAAGAALAVGLLYFSLRFVSLNRNAILLVTTAAGILLANARGLSLLWLALIGIAVLVFVPWNNTLEILKEWRVRFAFGAMAAGAVFAAVWVITTGTLGSLGVYPGAGTNPLRALATMMLDRSADPGFVGYFGWLDTPAPNFTYFAWCALFGLVIVGALSTARGRPLVAAFLAFASVSIVPAVVQAASVQRSGYIWQGRYTLIAIVCALLIAAVASGATGVFEKIPPRVTSRIMTIVAILVTVGQLYAMDTAIRRYALPGSDTLFMFRTLLWSPPGGVVIWLVLMGVSMAMLIILWFGTYSAFGRTPASAIGMGTVDPVRPSLASTSSEKSTNSDFHR